MKSALGKFFPAKRFVVPLRSDPEIKIRLITVDLRVIKCGVLEGIPWEVGRKF